jgi:hypothetical protein
MNPPTKLATRTFHAIFAGPEKGAEQLTGWKRNKQEVFAAFRRSTHLKSMTKDERAKLVIRTQNFLLPPKETA